VGIVELRKQQQLPRFSQLLPRRGVQGGEVAKEKASAYAVL